MLTDNPLLIQKIVAERLSDKMQIMMVPMDGQNFFASERPARLRLLAPGAAAAGTRGTRAGRGPQAQRAALKSRGGLDTRPP